MTDTLTVPPIVDQLRQRVSLLQENEWEPLKLDILWRDLATAHDVRSACKVVLWEACFDTEGGRRETTAFLEVCRLVYTAYDYESFARAALQDVGPNDPHEPGEVAAAAKTQAQAHLVQAILLYGRLKHRICREDLDAMSQ